jgi:hypothetical protein
MVRYPFLKLRVMSPAKVGRYDFACGESDDMIAANINAAKQFITLRSKS